MAQTWNTMTNDQKLDHLKHENERLVDLLNKAEIRDRVLENGISEAHAKIEDLQKKLDGLNGKEV